MAKEEIDDYLSELTPVEQRTLSSLRRSILDIIPDAEECISYRMPAFRIRGEVIAGFAAYRQHLSYFPHSGSVLDAVGDDLRGYSRSKSALRFAPDTPLPRDLVAKLINIRLEQAFESK